MAKVEHSPWGASADLEYDYDELGRVIRRTIGGDSANFEEYVYDATGRLDALKNNLSGATGQFDYVYKFADEALPELEKILYPNGQSVEYGWGANAQDRRLSEIVNRVSPTSELSRFGYDYRPSGEIAKWTRQFASGVAERYDLAYDDAGQLTEAKLLRVSDGASLRRHAYTYDDAGNRLAEQTDVASPAGTTVLGAVYNELNQLVSRGGGGPTVVKGSLSEAGTVTVAANGGAASPATMLTGKNFVATPPLVVGANTLAVTAKDGSNNATLKQWQVTLPAGQTAVLTYDDNGNLLDDGAGRTFEWDAADRMIAINSGSGQRTEFTYDPLGRRVKIVEKTGGAVTSTKQHLWAGGPQPAEERDASGAVTKRFFAHGVQTGSTNYFYSHDHLGSIRELTDGTGAVRARYDYDPYGRRTKVSGDLDADFGFTGHYFHAPSSLNLTLYRAYDANLGRWLSRDPIGERGGTNFYAYVGGDPINAADPTGLISSLNSQEGAAAYLWMIEMSYSPIAIPAALGTVAAVGAAADAYQPCGNVVENAVNMGVAAVVNGFVTYALSGGRIPSFQTNVRAGIIPSAPNVSSAAETAGTRAAGTTRLGVVRNNPADWRATRDLWDAGGYGDILSPANRAAIARGRTPVVDQAWVRHFPEDAGLLGERIPMHHIQGTPITTPLPATRHMDAHMPGGFRYNPGGPGGQVPIYPATTP